MLKRLTLALALLAPLAACGPDCDKFCNIWTSCPAAAGANRDRGQCVQGCNEVGGDNAAFINCVVDKGCSGIAQGHCVIPGVAPGIVQ
jgi:hypothetical protein